MPEQPRQQLPTVPSARLVTPDPTFLTGGNLGVGGRPGGSDGAREGDPWCESCFHETQHPPQPKRHRLQPSPPVEVRRRDAAARKSYPSGKTSCISRSLSFSHTHTLAAAPQEVRLMLNQEQNRPSPKRFCISSVILQRYLDLIGSKPTKLLFLL